MVYGEFVQSPQYRLAKLLADNLPENLSTTYFVNSGAEAIEGAMKLAKRATGRSEIISCKDSYHGSTQGALSIMGNEEHKAKYRPLLPNCNQIIYNDEYSLKNITRDTAAVVIEPIQGGTGFVTATKNFLSKVRERCTKTGTLLIFDEIQTCFGRLGTLFGFEEHNVTADILCIAKGMGGGMPGMGMPPGGGAGGPGGGLGGMFGGPEAEAKLKANPRIAKYFEDPQFASMWGMC